MFPGMRAFAPLMAARRRAAIVNMPSANVLTGIAGRSAYAANAFDQVRVDAVFPGSP
ncbi:hypothetical protein [Paraburkholderia xenovorans]